MIPKCCCATCADIAADTFTRTDETPVASPWVKLSGTDANLSGNVLDFPAAADYKHTTAYPGAITESQHASVKVKFSTAGSVEVHVGKTDASNYFAAALQYVAGGCSILTAGVRVAGTGPGGCTPGPSITGCLQIGGLTTGVWYTLEVCLIPNNGSYGYGTYDTVIAKLTTDAGLVYSCQLLVEGPTVGTLSGLKSSVAAQFDDFKYTYYRNSPSGEHKTCPWCHTNCSISSDNFTTDEPCLWDVRSGSYSVSGGLMTMTAAGSAIQHHIFHPGLKTTHKVTVDVQDGGVESLVYIGNGYAKLTYSAGLRTLTLYDNDSNVLDTDAQTVSVTADSGLYMALTLCYSRGVLSCTVTGRGSDLCVDASIAETAEAYWAALGGENGAVFDNFVFAKTYDTTEPSDAACDDCAYCPNECTDCCDSPQPAGAYIVDLGAGGWTPGSWYEACDDCDACSTTEGEYVVLATGTPCNWYYEEDNCNFTDEVCVSGQTTRFQIIMQLYNDGLGNGCKWSVAVLIGPLTSGDGDETFNCTDTPFDEFGEGGGLTGATYLSDYISDTECDTMPVTLTKTSETATCPCNGSLPATITLEAA